LTVGVVSLYKNRNMISLEKNCPVCCYPDVQSIVADRILSVRA
jgi:hypothetical protein